jgi:hypothetical protein
MYMHLTHDCFSGKFSEFNRWKSALLKAAGYPVPVYSTGFPMTVIPWDMLPKGADVGDWGKLTPQDPLGILLVHAYNKGHIKPREGKLLLERLKQILPAVEQEFQETTEQFIAGLRAAIAANERVEFF